MKCLVRALTQGMRPLRPTNNSNPMTVISLHRGRCAVAECQRGICHWVMSSSGTGEINTAFAS